MTPASHSDWAARSDGENRLSRKSARAFWPASTALTHCSHRCESMIVCCVAAVWARPASARRIADDAWASACRSLHWLAWKEAHAAATAAMARMMAVQESRMRWRRSHGLVGSDVPAQDDVVDDLVEGLEHRVVVGPPRAARRCGHRTPPARTSLRCFSA